MLALIEAPFEVCAHSGDAGCTEAHTCAYVTRTLLICPACHAHDAAGELIHEPACILAALRAELTEVLASLQLGHIAQTQTKLEHLLGPPSRCDDAPGTG